MSIEVWGLILGIVAIVIGIPALVFALPQIKGSVTSLWNRRRIAILGPQAAGKTTLVSYLRDETAPRRHVRTVGAQVYGRVALDLTGDKAVYFAAKEVVDVGGEFRQQWASAIRTYNPHGIVYVVDTSHQAIELAGIEYIFEIYRKWTEETVNKNILLSSILILVNKADIWGGDVATERVVVEEYEQRFEAVTTTFESLLGNSIVFGCTSLTHVSYKERVNQHLRAFSTSMNKDRG